VKTTGDLSRIVEPRILYWFVHPSTVPPTALGFIRDNSRGALLIGGLTGSHYTGHKDTWWVKFRGIISDGYIPLEVAQAQGLVSARWQPPALEDTDDAIVRRIQGGET
jgi:hypothetical protein